MKKLLLTTLLLFSVIGSAELPSWGMTENQYKLPNFPTKMKEIGKQAVDNYWLLKITAPKDWHNKIRSGLTDSGAMDVQVNFKDSLHNSIAITAAPGIKMAKVTPSSTSGTTVQKQVVIDKPEIDTEVEAPEFGEIEVANNTDALLEGMADLSISVPTAENTTVVKDSAQTQVAQTPVENVQTETPSLPSNSIDTEEIKESLRKRHARTKRVEKILSYSSITPKDDLFIQDNVVLIKRFINQGVVLYFWMKEAYDPAIHKLIEKGSGKYQKDDSAVSGAVVKNQVKPQTQTEPEAPKLTDLDFVAVDTDIDTQDELRKDYARNKRVDVNIRADQLKADDVLYVMNNTVLVERPITSTQSAYYWLVGNTTIPRELENKDDNIYIVL